MRSANGGQVPLSSLMRVDQITGPEFIQRFNEYNGAQINDTGAPGYSSGQVRAALEEVFQVSGVNYSFRSHCRTIFATDRGVVASSKMLPATDHQVAPEGGDEETHELGSTQGTDRCSSSQVQ